MSDVGGLEALLILILVALLPALVYLSWVRKSERFMTEPWGPLLGAFAYGAIVATFFAAILEVVLIAVGNAVSQQYPGPESVFLNNNSSLSAFFLVLVIAPLVEEAIKAYGVTRYSDRIRIVSDGPVFGASVGLGFGFFETFLYGAGAYLAGGLAAGITLIVIRSISSVLLHGSTTAVFGFGYADSRLSGVGYGGTSHYFAAVGMHSLFNVLASLGAIVTVLGFSTGYADYASAIGFVVAVAYAFAAIEYARSVIARTNHLAAPAPHSKYKTPAVVRPKLGQPPRYR